MTLEEIKNKAYYEIKKAQEKYRDRLNEYLEENDLRGEVIRVKDGKIGFLYTEFDWSTKVGYQVVFYPLKKDGTKSKKHELVWEEHITEKFKPHKN